MFFYPSKLFWFIAQPTNALTLLVLLGAILAFTRLVRRGRWMALVGATGLIMCGMSPLPYWLLRPLEDRFARPTITAEIGGDITGIIVLGGAIGTARGLTSMNEDAARMTESVALARAYPNAKLVFTGGSATLIEAAPDGEAKTEAEAARQFYTSLGIAPERLILEDASRNTRENAMLTVPLLNAKPGERWLLVTSAWHMPRSVGSFRKAGVDVIPYPVDYTTRGTSRDFRQINRSFSNGLKLTDGVVREWIGLGAYWLAGYTDAPLPGPR